MNLGTGMRASVHVDLPGWTKEGLSAPKARSLAFSHVELVEDLEDKLE